jgi:hypothetical protein
MQIKVVISLNHRNNLSSDGLELLYTQSIDAYFSYPRLITLGPSSREACYTDAIRSGFGMKLSQDLSTLALQLQTRHTAPRCHLHQLDP